MAAAISLGAYAVYVRARGEKVADMRHHVAELAQRLAPSTSDPHMAVKKLPPAQRGQVAPMLSSPLAYVRDNSDEVRRIYTFTLEDGENLTLLDTGMEGEKPRQRPLPAHAVRAIERYKNSGTNLAGTAWTVTDGLETTAFSLLPSRNKGPAGVIGIEADANKLQVKISTVRGALWFTCLLGVAVGVLAGFIIWRMRFRAALALAQIEEARRIEDAIITSLGEVIYTFNTAMKTFLWRGNVAPLLGFTPEHGEGQHRSDWLARLHHDDLPGYLEAQEKSVRDSAPMQIEYRVRRPDGSLVWVLDRSHPMPLSDGHIYLVGSLIDLTARRAAEETLRLFFDETATAHIVFDSDIIIDANPAAVALFAAASKEALASKPVWSLWPKRQPTHALSAEGWATQVISAMESGASHFEWQFVRIDGVFIDCDVFLRKATLGGRAVLLLACYDISPAKNAQMQLIQSEQRFRDVSDAAGEFIWEVNGEGRYIYASNRVRDVLGVEPNDLLGRSPFEFVPDEDRDKIRKRSEEIHAAGRAFRNFEHRVVGANGAVRWISISGVPSYDASGRIAGYRGASLDITKHRDYERELLLQKEAAETADRAKSNFLAMMSHEIRTPLNSVLGFADLLLGTQLDHLQREHLETIKSSGGALLFLLNDILDFSKIESGRMEIEILPTDPRRCVREVMDLYRLSASTKKLTLSDEFAEDVPQYVLTDWARLRQILVNLIGNAVKFTNEGGVHVAVSSEPPKTAGGLPRMRIVVSDTGIGISAEQRQRLFKPFTQADSSTTRRFGGTGLGLAISLRLATLLEGEMGLFESNGLGASFYVILPASIPTAQQLAGMPDGQEAEPFPLGRPVEFRGRPPHVLVVDDNILNRRLSTHLLEQLGAVTAAVSSAEESFEMLSAADFDLVLMDVQMPVMDGLEATRHIRSLKNGRAVAIVALTADAMAGDRERCLAAGMNDYLTKPLRRDELARILLSYAPHG